MPNFSQYRKSKNLLERAAYYAVQASWADSADFEQAQADANTLLSLANQKSDNEGSVVKPNP